MQQSYNNAMPMPTYGAGGYPPQQHDNRPKYNYVDERKRKSDAVVSKLSNKLENADNGELHELHDSEVKLHSLLDNTDEVRQLEAEREMQLAGNRNLAEQNMKQGPKLTECKKRLGDLYKELNYLTNKFEENKRSLESLSGQYNPDTIMALLQASVAESEENSDKTADSFMDGDISVEEFHQKYLKERTAIHVRRTKVDKLKEISWRR